MENVINIKEKYSLTIDEEKLLKKFMEEYNEIYQNIILLSPNDFLQYLVKRVQISLREKFNGYSKNSKIKVLNYINEKIYLIEYKYAFFAKRSIQMRNTSETESHIFNGNIIPHCENDKKDGYYIHSCGKTFQIFKYKPISYSSNFEQNNNNMKNTNDILLYCEECDMIYKSSLIKFKCNSTDENFYSKLINNDEDNNYQVATWKKYHCNIIINDSMKCQICHDNLYISNDKKELFCKKCNTIFDPKNLIWKCIKCKTDFIAEPKIYNPLEYKNMKICIKETIINHRKAKPNKLECGCTKEIRELKFFHKNGCDGELYMGNLNNKKVVVCSKCESLGLLNGYVWTCPLCFKRFKNKTIEEEKVVKKNNKGKFINFSNNIWNINFNNFNNAIVSRSPIKRNNDKLFLNNQNEFSTESKKLKIFRRNNSALKMVDRERGPSNICSPSRGLQISDNKQNEIKLEMNKMSNNSPTKQKNESKIYFNPFLNIKNDFSNYKKYKEKKLQSNHDLSEGKNLDSFFNNCLEKKGKSEVLEVMQFNDDKFPKDNIRNESCFELNKENKDININLVNNNIYNNIHKIIIVDKKNNDSNLDNLKMDTDIINPLIKNNLRNNKILIKKAIGQRGRSANNCKREEHSTSCDSKAEKIPKDNIRKSPMKNRDMSPKHKDDEKSVCDKIIPGKLDLKNYLIKKLIGEGTFGQIFLVEDKYKNKFAMKKILANSVNRIKRMKKELQILLSVQKNKQNLNIVQIYGMTTQQLDITTYALYVLMELGVTDWEKEILFKKKKKDYYSEEELLQILSTITKSLSILQQQNISHRDLKPQNILIVKDSNGKKNYKLTDFGEAKELLDGEEPTNKQTLRGTEMYMSPILFYALRGRKKVKYVQHNPYKSDVFSLGLCALFAGTLGYDSIYDVRELKSNISMYVVVEKNLRFKYSDNVINIVSKMLDVDESTRFDFIALQKEFNNIGYY